MQAGKHMDVFEAIKKRHSYRGEFLDLPIPREHLVEIVKAAAAAPSGRNAQTTRFIIVDEPALVAQIGAMHTMPAMHSAKAFVVCLIDREPLPVYEGFPFQVEDCAAAVENMLLAVTALGYATVWIDGWLRIGGHAEAIGHLLDVPQHKIIRVLLPLGVPREQRAQKEKKPFTQRTNFNRYRSPSDA